MFILLVDCFIPQLGTILNLRAELSDNVQNDNGSNKGKRGNEDGGRSNLESRRIVRVELENVVNFVNSVNLTNFVNLVKLVNVVISLLS